MGGNPYHTIGQEMVVNSAHFLNPILRKLLKTNLHGQGTLHASTSHCTLFMCLNKLEQGLNTDCTGVVMVILLVLEKTYKLNSTEARHFTWSPSSPHYGNCLQVAALPYLVILASLGRLCLLLLLCGIPPCIILPRAG